MNNILNGMINSNDLFLVAGEYDITAEIPLDTSIRLGDVLANITGHKFTYTIKITESDENITIVYRTKTGSKYHK